MARFLQGRPWSVEIDQEMIEISSNLPRADPDWEYADRAGHVHRYADGLNRWPTLLWVYGDVYIDSDGEEWYPDAHLVCRQCNEVIEPEMIPADPFPQFIPGIVSYTLRGVRESDQAKIVMQLRPEDVAAVALLGDYAVQYLLEHTNDARLVSITRRTSGHRGSRERVRIPKGHQR